MIKFIPLLLMFVLLLFGWLLPWLFSQKSDQSVVIGALIIVMALSYAAYRLDNYLKSRKEKSNEN